jgi:hypothetical protein
MKKLYIRLLKFEQTFGLTFSVRTDDCFLYNLTSDANKQGYYYFFPLWSSECAL